MSRFKEREDVDPFFYDPDAEAEYLADYWDRKRDEQKDELIENHYDNKNKKQDS